MTVDRKKHLAMLLAALVATGMLIFAGVHLARWVKTGGDLKGGLSARRIPLRDAPAMVQSAAAHLMGSRVAHVIPMGEVTYLVVSAGTSGERLSLVGARRESAAGAEALRVDLKSDPAGDRVLIAVLNAGVVSARSVGVTIDGRMGLVPRLINDDALPLSALPEFESLVVLFPQEGVRLAGSAVEVTGFARLPGGRLSIQLFTAGKGRSLGEEATVVASAGSPDWGSFRALIPANVPDGVTEGVVLVYDKESGAKVAIPVRFGSK